MLKLAYFSVFAVFVLESRGCLANLEGNQYCSKTQPPSIDLLPEMNSKLQGIEEDQRNLKNTLQAILAKIEGTEPSPQQSDSKSYEKTIPPNFHKIGTRYFYIENNLTLPWNEAAGTCHQMGGYLAGIKDQKELYAIQLQLEEGVSYWLGINDLISIGNFVSVASGKKAKTLKLDKQLDHWTLKNNCETGKCLKVRDVIMSRVSCEGKNHFICQADSEI
nr:accessory gland protein Acp29AB-like [Drosophila suzukii]